MFKKELLENQTNRFIRVAALIGGMMALAGAYTWYLNYIWKPKVIVKDAFDDCFVFFIIRSLSNLNV